MSARLVDHVNRIEDEHPPIPLASVDFSVRRPDLVRDRYGHVLDYMARVELEVDRNVLELTTMLPDPPEIDVRFYRDVWHHQELAHGRILDRLQVTIGRPPTQPDTTSLSVKIRLLGAVAHAAPVQDIARMLYYLTGLSTERSAVVAYGRLYDGLRELDERAIAETAIAPIRRQEPGHYAFYKMSAQALAARLAPWQRWLTRRLRALSYGPVGANDDDQRADFGGVLMSLGLGDDLTGFAHEIGRVEADLLGARERGLEVPTYVLTALRDAVQLHRERADPLA